MRIFMTVDRKISSGLRAGLAVLCLAMTGCSGSVYHVESYGGFSNAALEAQSRTEGLQIQVDGSVGAVRGAPLAAAVATAMPTSVNGAPIRYAPCEAFSECPGDHLVWIFGPPAARPASAYPPAIAMNINWVGTYRPDPNNVTIKAALFQNGEVVSTAAGQVDASAPGDPAFQATIRRMATDVLSGPGLLYAITP
jgi:hypothetical protein